LRLFSGADRTGPQTQEEASQEAARHPTQSLEAVVGVSRTKPTNLYPHGRMRITEVSGKGKPAYRADGLAATNVMCRMKTR
jgi:hypothetical protein